MINENWIEYKNIYAVPKIKTKTNYSGNIYILEFGDNVKIGKSKQVRERLNHLLHLANNYALIYTGKVLVSKPCTNYGDIETLLHRTFKDKRIKKGELFDLKFDYVKEVLFRSDIEFEDKEYILKQQEEQRNIEYESEIIKIMDYCNKTNEYDTYNLLEQLSELLNENKKIQYIIRKEINMFESITDIKYLTIIDYCEGRGITLDDDVYLQLEDIVADTYFNKYNRYPNINNYDLYVYSKEEWDLIDIAFNLITKFDFNKLKKKEDLLISKDGYVTVIDFVKQVGINEISEELLNKINQKLKEIYFEKTGKTIKGEAVPFCDIEYIKQAIKSVLGL